MKPILKNKSYKELLTKIVQNPDLADKKKLIRLLTPENANDEQALINTADQVRNEYVGEKVHLRAIIEFSNHCRRSCLYCGLRHNNKELERYRITPDDLFSLVCSINDMGYRTVVFQSGEDPELDLERLIQIIKRIKKELRMAVTLSIGELEYVDYQRLRKAGADRYLLKHETGSSKLYNQLHPESRLAKRLERLEWLRKIGYQIGTGNIVGLPGQTIDNLVQDLLLFRDIRPDMIGVGPFIPHKSTPLNSSERGTFDLTLRVLALTRILIPQAHLPATTALRSLVEEGMEKALHAGANVVMLNLTPDNERKLYSIYPHKGRNKSSTPIKEKKEIEKRIKSMGREISQDQGHSLLKTQEV